MPSPAQQRRKWIYDDEQFVRGHIWSLEEAVAQELARLFLDSRARLQQSMNEVFERYATGGTWSASDVAFRQRTDYLMAQIEAETGRLIGQAQAATLFGAEQGYMGGAYGRAWLLENGLLSDKMINLPIIPTEAARAAILAPYRGLTFIDRFADARDDFTRRIRRSIVQSQIEGDTIYQAQKRLADSLGINIARRKKAERLANQGLFNRTEMIARTEILRSSNLGAMQIYMENQDVLDGWQWLLTFDERTCSICIGKNANNKVYSFEERETPPAHPRCRCTVVPALEDEALEQRIAGKRMTYDEWAASRGVQGADGGMMSARGRPAPKSPTEQAKIAARGPRPEGKPISEALSIPSGKAMQSVRDAVNAINSVHGDGDLPAIPIKASSAKRRYGAYWHSSGKSIKITVDPKSEHPRLTSAHEVGHFLDHQTINRRGHFASLDGPIWPEHLRPAMDKWADATWNSRAFTELRNIKPGTSVMVKLEDGRQFNAIYDKRYLSYLKDQKEVWARSYAQYIATRSGDSAMRAELQSIVSKQNIPLQWNDDDFKPVAEAFDDIFKVLGWRR